MLLEIAMLASCASLDTPAIQRIRTARHDFNKAIVAEEIKPISEILSPDVILVTGTDSTVIIGRDAQLSIWREDFADDNRLVFQRRAQCIELSPLYPIAMERGTWRGAREAGGEENVSGQYIAKWRLLEGVWRIEAETYATTGCGGALCPDHKSDR